MSLFRKLLFENSQIKTKRVALAVCLGNTKPSEIENTKDGWVNFVGQNVEDYKCNLINVDKTPSRISHAFVSSSVYPGGRGMQAANQNPIEPVVYTGPYNFHAISVCSYYNEYNQPQVIIPHRYIFFCPLGRIYNVRIFASGPDKNAANYTQQWYECSGNTVQPSESMKDNFDKWITINNCKVDLEGRLIIKYWGDPTRAAMCLVNLIEITEI